MPDVPYSSQFDDIYFSKQDGLAETRHVFLEGNNLPEAWKGQKEFTIFETGFGTGLNFLATWSLFDEAKNEGQKLHFISVEKYPLQTDSIELYLKHWENEFGDRLKILCDLYPSLSDETHQIKVSEDVTLTLIFDDVNKALPELETQIDVWFLDGFTPAKNPDMWRDSLFEQMARLSKGKASVATFTAAGAIKRGLAKNGFDVLKVKGFGLKRDMITAIYQQKQKSNSKKTIAIIGAGLAGTAMAYVLNQQGYKVTIYDSGSSIANAASGNEQGFYNPRFAAQWDESAQFFSAGYTEILKLGEAFGHEFDFDPCDALHIINDQKKAQRFSKMLESWEWDESQMRLVQPDEASQIAGIELQESCLYLPQSGSLNLRKLCKFYAKGIDIKFNQNITDLNDLSEGIIILCNAHQANSYSETGWLELESVRGQISKVAASPLSQNINCNLHYGGYISRTHAGMHTIGATFQKWLNHRDITQEDHSRNIEIMQQNIPVLAQEEFDIQSGWAGFRCASKDRFPIVGKVPSIENTYISTAFGSHGIVGSLIAAHYISDLIQESDTLCLSKETQYALSPQRFLDRMQKKQGTAL